MTADEWRRRQDQWAKFQAWERTHTTCRLSPSERLAEIGELVDLALKAGRFPGRNVEQCAAGIRLMRLQLAVLGDAA